MEPPSTASVEILLQRGLDAPLELVRRAVVAAIQDQGVRGSVEILVTDDAHIRDLNRRFRGVDSATDVLTFPGGAQEGGEIAISLPTAQLQASLRGIDVEEELAYLAIHGVLHLAGMEDDSDEGREAMQAEMARIGAQVPLPFEAAWTSLYRMEGAPA